MACSARLEQCKKNTLYKTLYTLSCWNARLQNAYLL
jgi:hypothetical protein